MDNPALTIGLAMALGMMSQVIARKFHLPGIVVLLAAGVIFGPDGLSWIQPSSMGPALQIIVGFAVAVILFEGQSHQTRRISYPRAHYNWCTNYPHWRYTSYASYPGMGFSYIHPLWNFNYCNRAHCYYTVA